DARRLAHDARGAHDPERPRAPGRVARGRPAREAGRPDAELRAQPLRAERARDLRREPQVTAVAGTEQRLERLEGMWQARPGVVGWLTTTDHKRIGLLYFWTTLAFFGAGGVEALIMRTQLAKANAHVVGPGTYDELFTM